MIIEPRHSLLFLDFKKHANVCSSKNPKLIGYSKINNGVVEITKQKTKDGKLWIVKVVRNNKYDSEAFKKFRTYNEVEPYLKRLDYEDTSVLKTLLEAIL